MDSASSGAVASRMPLVEVSGICLTLLRYCGHKTRESLLEMRETQQLVSKVWALDSRLPLAAFGIAAHISVPVTRCLGAEVRGVVAAASCEHFIVCVSQCVALFFAKRGDHWVVAVHCDTGVVVIGWTQPEAHCRMRAIAIPHPITEPPTVAVLQMWQTAIGNRADSMTTNGDSIAVGKTLLNAHTGVASDSLKGTRVVFLDKHRVVGVKMEGIRNQKLYEFIGDTLTNAVPIEAWNIRSVKASANGKRLYVCDRANTQLLQYSTGNWLLTARIPLSGIKLMGQFDVAANGLLAHGINHREDDSYCIEVIETNSHCVTHSIRTKHISGITQVVFSPNSRRIASISFDETVQLFDAMSGRMIGEPRVFQGDFVFSLCFLSDDWFVTVSDDCALVIWHCDSQPPIARFEDAHDFGINYVLRLSNDSFATLDRGGTVKKWKLEWK